MGETFQRRDDLLTKLKLKPEASSPAPLTIPGCPSVLLFSVRVARMSLLYENKKGKERKDYGGPAIPKILCLRTYFYLIL